MHAVALNADAMSSSESARPYIAGLGPPPWAPVATLTPSSASHMVLGTMWVDEHMFLPS